MRPLFSSSADAWLRLALLLAAMGIVGTPLVLMALVRTPWLDGTGDPVAQPVLFDHRHHVLDAGIDCLHCHWLADRSPTAGVPPTELCLGCHGQIWNDSPLLAPVRRSFAEGRPIPWVRVHDLPDFVFFHHGAHVAKGVPCVACHGEVWRMGRIHQAHPMRMSFCLGCHRDPLPHVGDPATVTAIDWSPGRGRGPVHPVDPPTHCTGCHR